MGNGGLRAERACGGQRLSVSFTKGENQFNRRFVLAILAMAGLLATKCQSLRAADSLVGVAGDITAAEVRGCRLVSADKLRHALLVDAAVQLAGSPSAPMDEFIKTVQRSSQEDYLANGYANARVGVELDPSGHHLLIHVNEGPRYTAGNAEIIGASLADAKALVSALTQPSPREPDAAQIDERVGTLFIPTWKSPEGADAHWKVGNPANLSNEDLDDYKDQIVKALLSQGLFWADVKVEPELRSDHIARLVVRILNEGPKGILTDIQTTGLSINTRQQVLDFAGLRPGMSVDLNVLRAVRKKFWDSGRFFQHDIGAKWSPANPGKVSLTMDFWEHPNVPPLSKPIPADSPQGIMLRMARSMQESMEKGESFALKFDYGRQHGKVVMQADRGFAVHWTRDAVTGAPASAPSEIDSNQFFSRQAPQGLDLTIVATPKKLDVFSVAAHHRFTISTDIPLDMNLNLVPDPTNKERPVSLMFYVGVPSDSYEGDPPIRLECSIAPVACLDLVTRLFDPSRVPTKTEMRDGILQVEETEESLRVDAASGRPIQWTIGPAEFKFEPGAMDREIAADATPGSPANDYDPQHPASSLIHFLTAWNASCPIFNFESPQRTEAIAHFVSILAKPALESLDQEMAGPAEDDSDFEAADKHIDTQSPIALLRGAVGYVNFVFAYGTWPWTISREALLIASGGSPDTEQEIIRVASSEETGPIGYAALAAAMRPMGLEYAQAMARLGLNHLSADGFKHDFHVLLQGPGIGPKTLSNLLQAVADLSDDDFSVLSTEIPTDWVDALRYVRQVAKQHPGQPIVDALAGSTDEWWNGSVRKIVESELRRESEVAP
ncbi:MAG: hypothetical protein ABSH08_04205 [Tepidisphaeraceae bacterium]|jgi:hypothetical protein